MEKYTVVYNSYTDAGHHVPSYAMIKTDDLDKYLEGYEEVIVVFEGWVLEGWPMIVYPPYSE